MRRGARLISRREERWRRDPRRLGASSRAYSAPPACLAGDGLALNMARVLVEVVEQRGTWPGVALTHGHARVLQCAHQRPSPLAPQDGAPNVHAHVVCVCTHSLRIGYKHHTCTLHAHKVPSRSPAASSSSAYASIPIGPSAALDSAASRELSAEGRGGGGGGDG